MAAIEKITRQSYEDSTVILNQACARNNTIYLCMEGAILRGFFMTGWSVSPFGQDNEDVAIVYVGLTAIEEGYKSRGIGRRLFAALSTDAVQWQEEQGQSLYFWFTTASPQFANAWWRMTKDISPDRDGLYTDKYRAMAQRISASFSMIGFASNDHPFLFRACTKVRYSKGEIQRLLHIFSNDDNLLARLGVDETAGDRLLFIGSFST